MVHVDGVHPAPRAHPADRERQRLTTRLRKLADLYSWGDIEEPEYRRSKADVEAALMALPEDPDKVMLFDQRRRVVQSLGDEIADMSPESIQQIVALLVDHVETRAQLVVAVHWSGSARPFFTADAFTVAPPDGLGGSDAPSDPLAWYVGVAA